MISHQSVCKHVTFTVLLYEANMSERNRALPSWMAKNEEKVKEKVKKEPLRSSRRRKTTRAAFYCMNEKELVEAAVSFLTNEGAVLLPDHQDEDKAADSAVKTKEKPAEVIASESSDCGDDPEATYVSETDEDVTEVETVPYTTNPQCHVPGGQRSGPTQDHDCLLHVEQKEEEKAESSQTRAEAAEDDDALRLVREIFFT